ncbi:hypothetical protein [Streptomyces roseochromogenus]|uniref:hypothetical protein n=1 Tax=Streptomyces roseochromogenus TaxID=285450 RepID=UPI001FD85C0A|nr:hypothetical protein [Streptomyces roseochromogenus]
MGDNLERLDSEASFAALCGVGPVERAGSRRARPGAKSSDASNATRPGKSSTWSDSYSQDPAHRGCVMRRSAG